MPGLTFAEWMIERASALVPPPLRSRWEREWKAELFYRERALAEQRTGSLRASIALIRPALGAFVHGGWLRIQNPGFDGVFQDLVFAVRSSSRAPVFTGAVVLTLALGIAANVMVLAVVEGALLKPYPYAHADRIAVLVNRDVDYPGVDLPLAYPDVEVLRANGVLESVTAVDWDPFNLRLGDRTEWVGGGLVTASAFETFGLEAILGRTFRPDEDDPGAAPVVVLGEGLWQTAFGGQDVIGDMIWLDGVGHEVIGVVPATMDVPAGAELWVPLRPTGEQRTRNSHWVQAYGRLADGVTWDQARVVLDGLGANVAAAFPETSEGRTFVPIPIREARTAGMRPALVALLGAVGLLLLIVCANLAGLVLARTAARESEFEIRRVLGASKARLVRQHITESLVLAGFGGAVGFALGIWGLGVLRALVPERPVWFSPDTSASVFAGAVVLTLLSAVLFGFPALGRTGGDPRRAARSGRWETRRSRSVFVFAQVALSTMLLISAGLLIRSLSHLTSVDPGFESERRISGTLQLPEIRYGDDLQLIRFVDRLLESTEARPEVTSAAVVTRMPFQSGAHQVRWWADGQAETAFRENPRAELNSVSPGYFSTMGIDVRRGRPLDISDHYEAVEVVVINETFARRFFGARDPIGHGISFAQRPAFREIVGVVEDTKQWGLDQASTYQIYVPFDQRPTARISLVVESGIAPEGVAGGMRRVVRDLDPDLALSGLSMVEDRVRHSVWQLRLLTRAFWGIGIFAVLLTTVGIAGIVAQTVVRRTREIGIRVALGAESAHILRLVGRGIGRILVLGLVTGVVSALMIGRLARGILYGVEPGDPVTIVVVIAGFTTVGALAAWLPARRAVSIDPADALRAE